MAVITIPGLFLTGNHAGRPAATAVGTGGVYSCTTHGLIYQSDGATWSTWATLGGAAVDDATIATSDITTNNASTSKHGWLKKLSNVAGEFMNGQGNWATPAGAGPPSDYEAFLTAPVTLVDNATWYDGPSITPAAGSYRIGAQAELSNAHASNTYQTLRIYDGTTVLVARGAWSSGGAGGAQSLSVSARVTTDGSKTYTLQVRDIRTSSNGVLLDTATNNGTTDKCTLIFATAITAI